MKLCRGKDDGLEKVVVTRTRFDLGNHTRTLSKGKKSFNLVKQQEELGAKVRGGLITEQRRMFAKVTE